MVTKGTMRISFIGRVATAGCLAGALAVGVGAASGGLSSASAQTITTTCNNSTTDSGTIQTAINNSNPGDTIQINGGTAGTCDITAMLVLKGDRTYAGTDTTGTVLQQANGENLPALMAAFGWVNNSSAVDDGIRIKSLTLNADALGGTNGTTVENTGTNGIILRNYNFRVYDVFIENTPNDGILMTNQSKNGTAATNNSINSIISDSWIDGFGNDGVQDADSGNSITDDSLLSNWINSNAVTGQTGVSDVNLGNAAGWDVSNNHFYGPVSKDAVEADRCYNTTVASNYVEEFGQSGGSGNTWYGIYCGLQGGSVNVIANNKMVYIGTIPSTGSFDYIGVSGNYGSALASITGNAIQGTGTGSTQTGLAYSNGNASSTAVVSTGNLVTGVSTQRSSGAGTTVTAGS